MSASLEVNSRTSSAARTGFWIVAAFGILAAALAWSWYGFVQFEAQSEQGKALAADTSMAGFAQVFGVVPLVVAHLLGLALALILGRRGYGRRGMIFAVIAVLVASGVGIGCAQMIWAGELFDLGIHNADVP